jgi:hypothetical protein
MNLTDIGRKYGTDKVYHGFTSIYDDLFFSIKDESFNLLEIGVYFGSSIRMWNEYFKNAIIYGSDTFQGFQGNGSSFKDPKKYYNEWLENKPNNIKLDILNQSSKTELINFYNKYNDNTKFKIIIDDGSHLMKDQQLTFFYLFDLLENGGIYVIEDIHTSDQRDYDVNASNSTKQIFLDILNGKDFVSQYIDDTDKCISITKYIKNIELKIVNNNSQTLIVYKK